MKRQPISESTKDRIIAMAWDDQTSFDAIERETGYTEADVIELMRRSLKAGSFRAWRKRVSGRKAKHEKLMRPSRRSETQALSTHRVSDRRDG